MRTDRPLTARRTLGTLQPSAENNSVLVGSAGKVSIDKKKVDTKKRRLNFDLDAENNPPRIEKLKGSEKTLEMKSVVLDEKLEVIAEDRRLVLEKNAYDILVKDEPGLEYWKNLAEERRVALEKALAENEKLHEEVDILEAENKHLQKMADHCVELAEIVKKLTEGDEEDDEAETMDSQ